MTAYIKLDGSWVEVNRPYIKRNNVWTPAKEVLVKTDGVWEQSYVYDAIPPSPPELTLQVRSNRYIVVGARLPGITHDPTLKLIRVLASRTEMPTSPLGSGYLSGNDSNWSKEDWSNWYYNGQSPAGSDHGDSFDYDFKDYPVGADTSTNLPGGQHYYFAAWSQDIEGNWSVGTFNKIWMPKEGAQAEQIVLKEANIQANAAGSLNANGVAFTEGDLVARESPVSNGIWYHGMQFTNSVGSTGSVTIRSAKIRISRTNDSGQATARVNLFWHGKAASTDLPVPAEDMQDVTDIGSINKGETKWFDIPTAWYSKFNTQIRGFGLRWGNEASDYIVVKGLEADLRCGEVNLVWEETL